MSQENLWDLDRVKYYLKQYLDPREKRGSQSRVCRDTSTLLVPGSVLDCPCGIGHLIPFVEGREYIGVDHSTAMLTQAQLLFPDKIFYPKDATDFTMGRLFDNVVCVSMLLHLEREEAKKALQCMWNHVEPAGGALIFSMETDGDRQHRRVDGLLLRNQSVDEVLKDLREIIGDWPEDTRWGPTWTHQIIVYQTISEVVPSLETPLLLRGHRIVARTTLFKVLHP